MYWFEPSLYLESGQAYSWGNGKSGCLGHSNRSNVSVPQRIECFGSIQIRFAACGDSHSMFVSSDGDLYVCGSNKKVAIIKKCVVKIVLKLKIALFGWFFK